MADLSVKQFLIRRGFNPNKGIRQVVPNAPVISVRNLFKMENVATIDIYPKTSSINVPLTDPFQATVKDGFHVPKEGVHVIWDLSNQETGSLKPKDTITDKNGHASTYFYAAKSGKTKIYANCESKTGIADETVNPEPTQAVLHILDTWAEPASPDPGQPFTVYCTFRNNGNKASDPFKIRFERQHDGGKDSVEIDSRSLEPNEPGKAWWPFNNGLTAGQHYFYVYLIPAGDNVGYVGIKVWS